MKNTYNYKQKVSIPSADNMEIKIEDLKNRCVNVFEAPIGYKFIYHKDDKGKGTIHTNTSASKKINEKMIYDFNQRYNKTLLTMINNEFGTKIDVFVFGFYVDSEKRKELGYYENVDFIFSDLYINRNFFNFDDMTKIFSDYGIPTMPTIKEDFVISDIKKTKKELEKLKDVKSIWRDGNIYGYYLKNFVEDTEKNKRAVLLNVFPENNHLQPAPIKKEPETNKGDVKSIWQSKGKQFVKEMFSNNNKSQYFSWIVLNAGIDFGKKRDAENLSSMVNFFMKKNEKNFNQINGVFDFFQNEFRRGVRKEFSDMIISYYNLFAKKS